ncbi:uncharacterized protein K02A2.6-like [Ooceraea biroi]|uniref:uncharacterized protein K02A2.6-like n=1 Tax=Ooceraea biroi TaxID=2015173 RepID=UPI000F07F8F9|nr:uncharacterized protein K02A2.6-like [Ooceraea biroi]
MMFYLSGMIRNRKHASSYGLGGVLLQEDAKKNREVVAYASRTLSCSEKKYSQIEKEALALAYAAEHFKDFIIGIEIVLETDHKPLVQILQTKALDDLTPRLQRIRMRLMWYDYKVIYVPGKQLVLADCLSRNPIEEDHSLKDEFEEEISHYVRFVISHWPVSNSFLQRIKEEQGKDIVCRKLKDFCLGTWPNKDRLPSGLSVHEGHLGINKCRDRARQSIWWLGLNTQLKHLIESCPQCIEHRINNKDFFVKEAFPDRPWQKTLTVAEVISKCKEVFARFGIPEIVRSDCGTQFAFEFRKFAADYDFEHITSSPKYSQSNGAAETAVKIAKSIIKKCKDDIALGFLAYRTTPLDNGFTPAELMFSRKIRSRVPILPRYLGSFKEHNKIKVKEQERKDKQEHNYNKRHRSRKLSKLNVNDLVWNVSVDENADEHIVKADTNGDVETRDASEVESEAENTEPESGGANVSLRRSERDRKPNTRFRDFFMW